MKINSFKVIKTVAIVGVLLIHLPWALCSLLQPKTDHQEVTTLEASLEDFKEREYVPSGDEDQRGGFQNGVRIDLVSLVDCAVATCSRFLVQFLPVSAGTKTVIKGQTQTLLTFENQRAEAFKDSSCQCCAKIAQGLNAGSTTCQSLYFVIKKTDSAMHHILPPINPTPAALTWESPTQFPQQTTTTF